MNRRTSHKRVGRLAALVIASTVGIASTARAQTPPDFTEIGSVASGGLPNAGSCTAPMSDLIWLGFCSPVWKLPMGAPEIAFGGDAFANTGLISYNATTKVMTITAKITGVYFNTHGDNEQLSIFNPDPSAAGRGAASSVTLRVLIGNDGKFAGGAGNACGDGGFDDFCVIGELRSTTGASYGVNTDGTLRPVIRGRVEQATNQRNAITHSGVLWDDFEYYINMTGGDIVNTFWRPNGFTHILVESFGYNGGQVAYVGNNPFTTSFSELFMFGYTGVTANGVGFLFDPCNGRISGAVTDYFNPLSGIAGASVEITGPSLHVVLDPDDVNGGPWSSAANLCTGSYTVAVHAPTNYNVYTVSPYSSSYTVNIASVSTNNNSTVTGVNFKLYSSPVSSSAYTTFGQAAWGAKPKGQNAAALLVNYFGFMYSTGELVIGIPNTAGRFSVTETGPAAVQDFLPQEGKPAPLTASYIDPPSRFKPQHANKAGHHRKLGSLAGEMVTLELNVRFSAFGLTRNGLGGLKVVSGPLATWTVDQVLAAGNQALGGGALPTGVTYAQLEDIIERINKNFAAGTTDNGYLKQ
jgi:hypothetical protein